ncbi:MAG: translation initiation factor eIF-1A [Candidatus Bilamarchaeaceae archaeon]
MSGFRGQVAGMGGHKESAEHPAGPESADEVQRVRLPKRGELLGIITGVMGGGRMTVLCNDGKERMCRIPGKLKKKIWVKEGDAVAVIPWPIEGDKKADVAWRYAPNEKKWLSDKGYLKVG